MSGKRRVCVDNRIFAGSGTNANHIDTAVRHKSPVHPTRRDRWRRVVCRDSTSTHMERNTLGRRCSYSGHSTCRAAGSTDRCHRWPLPDHRNHNSIHSPCISMDHIWSSIWSWSTAWPHRACRDRWAQPCCCRCSGPISWSSQKDHWNALYTHYSRSSDPRAAPLPDWTQGRVCLSRVH